MCGIAGIFGSNWNREQLEAMVAAQRHRGPDGSAVFIDPTWQAGLGHNRLSIIDLSAAGRQPMLDPSGRYWIIFNGEIYNYVELRRELSGAFPFSTATDTEVLLAAYQRWGAACLDRLIGMFAFAIWDTQAQTLFAARDRFGVKPLYYHKRADGTLFLASEIAALHQGGVAATPDARTWATYFSLGIYDHSAATFWEGIQQLPPGHTLTWRDGTMALACWYDFAQRIGPDFDDRSVEEVSEGYLALLIDSVRLRFRSDVPVGINLSGGADSSTLLGLVQNVQGHDSEVTAFTFTTGDDRYDELPWVRLMLQRTLHPLVVCQLTPEMVPSLAESVQRHQSEPFGGLPTLAYAHMAACARRDGVVVLLDGQGMDEQWAGYDYFRNGRTIAGTVQGSQDSHVRPECLMPEFRAQAGRFEPPAPFPDTLRNLQLRDARFTKLPRALRFSDRVSMRSSVELREPFLDHRLVEAAFRQPAERKIQGGEHKWLLRRIAGQFLANDVVNAPKRPVQTPQREWLRGPLREWADACIGAALDWAGGRWLEAAVVRREWAAYQEGRVDNSFFVWQWVSLGLHAMAGTARPDTRRHGAGAGTGAPALIGVDSGQIPGRAFPTAALR